MELAISKVLRIGVRASAALIIVGVLAGLLGKGQAFSPEMIAGLVQGGEVRGGSYELFASAGIGLLLLLPVTSVSTMLGYLILRRERTLAAISAGVLAVLGLSVFLLGGK